MKTLKQHMNEKAKFKKGQKVKVVSDGDDYDGQTGRIFRVFRNEMQTVEFADGQVGSFGDDELVAESRKSDYIIHHHTFSDAISEVVRFVEKNGFTMDEDDFFNNVTSGPRKPTEGKTNSYKIDLLKNGKPVRKMAVFQVYGLKTQYELNLYIS